MRPTLRPCSCVAASYVPTFPWKPRRLNQAPAPKFPKTAQNAQEILRNRCYNSLVTRFDQVLESMSRTRDEMRLYQRARRAGLKAGTWPTAPKDAPTIAQRPALPPAKDSARTAIGGFPAALAVSLPATPTTGPRPREPCLAARRPRSGDGLARALSIAAPGTRFRQTNSPPPHTADGRPTSKPCSPPSRRKTTRRSGASPRSKNKPSTENEGPPRSMRWRERSGSCSE